VHLIRLILLIIVRKIAANLGQQYFAADIHLTEALAMIGNMLYKYLKYFIYYILNDTLNNIS
jgi:hypothetical protein